MDDALAPVEKMPLVDSAAIRLKWNKNTVVFASTDGSLILQRLTGSWLGGGASAYSSRTDPEPGYASAGVKTIRQGQYGYEGLGVDKLKDGMREAAERAIELAKIKNVVKPAEVGRYDLVFSPGATAVLVANTLGQALDLPRAMGYNANDVGTSFAAPPIDMLGKFRTASPLVTIQCDRNRLKGAATVGWDEEGVKPEEYTLVKDGVIVDYHTDRQTAAEIGGWYRSRGEAVRSHGVARRAGEYTPVSRLPNFTIAPGTGTTTVDDLVAGTKKGYYVEECSGASDQQLLNTQFGAGPVRTIVNGKLGDYTSFMAFQFITPQFWKSVDGIGGASSSKTMLVDTDGPLSFTQPFPMSTASSVPMRARQVNIMNVGRTA